MPVNDVLGAKRHRGGTVKAQSQSAIDQGIPVPEILQSKGRNLKVNYIRRDDEYEGWGLHVWADVRQETEWSKPLPLQGNSQDGFYFEVGLVPDQKKVNFHHWVGLLTHKGDEKDAGGEIVEIRDEVPEIWLLDGSKTVFFQKPDLAGLPRGDLSKSFAHWVNAGVIAWRMPPTGADGQHRSFKLHCSQDAALSLAADGVEGAAEGGVIDLEVHDSAGTVGPSVVKRFPFLNGCTALRLPESISTDPKKVHALLKQQLVVSVAEAEGAPVDATGVQLQGVLDELCFYEGPLGATLAQDSVHISVWAPTVQQVELLLWDGPRGGQAETLPMLQGTAGVWTAKGPATWVGRYYKYRVKVYSPWSRKVEALEATDPYSRSLAADGARTQIIDLSMPDLAPEGWSTEVFPPQVTPTDISVYELHIRDFSASDATVPELLRGKYLAFTLEETAGVKHLADLHSAGLTHVHLLPSYDFGSVPEREEDQQTPEGDLASYPSDSPKQQEAVWAVAATDAYQWGYDPVHYGVPEGSYATNPDGPARILECRMMVQGLHKLGLRVVLDVVYNHTFHSLMDGSDSPYAVLDKLVPGYYHRRTEGGNICASCCCNNVATEHLMAERLVIDDITHWARTYKVDGFRFDIMGHLMVPTMQKIQRALGALTLEKDGVDGRGIYIYGEAWDFGEVACNQRGRNASQLNIGGTGLGSFNDRFRDALMGGSPFASPRYQGFVSGLHTSPNSFMQAEASPARQLSLLLEFTDMLRLSLAGNLKDYEIVDARGISVRGDKLMYGSSPAGYAVNPWETVNYAACHDNETLFDQIILKSAEKESIEVRMRRCMLASALVAFSQGVAFFHAGDEILRSKSLDRDSYNSGDWFNRLDFSYTTNNFGVGLPPAAKNEAAWPIKQPLLADHSLKPSTDLIKASKAYFLELLQVRYSSPLFRLPTAAHIKRQVTFQNTGPQQVPGIIMMEVVSSEEGTHDPKWKRILTVFNASMNPFTGDWPKDAHSLQLHPILAASSDKHTRQAGTVPGQRTVSVPALTAAVFVEPV
ncbi:Pullulanase [Coccomyxa sp. Obi]|nr:Pullulanase [Coccomyxa sp. Obi]